MIPEALQRVGEIRDGLVGPTDLIARCNRGSVSLLHWKASLSRFGRWHDGQGKYAARV